MFDRLVDELRTWPTERLDRERDWVVGEQRRLHARELAVLRVLDERGQVDTSAGLDGESPRVVRDKVETARRLESLPHLGAAARDARLSDEQLSSASRLADEDSDAEWAERAPNVDPDELARLARNRTKPTAQDSRARFAARGLRTWWNRDKTMLSLRGQLPDEMGAKFEATIQKLTEGMKPRKGEAWDSFEHRAANALVQLCEPTVTTDEHAPTMAPRSVVQVHVPLHGPAEIAGVPIADSLLEQLRANASIELLLMGDDGTILSIGKRFPALSPKIVRAVRLRDGRCRYPGCARCHGLEVHHLVPRSRGGTDEIANLAAVCATHHRLLVPHGVLALVGNPNRPDGLRLERTGDARAGPSAA